MTSDAQKRANAKQDAKRKRVALWLDADGPEIKALEKIRRKHKLSDRMAALRYLLTSAQSAPNQSGEKT